MNLLDKIRAMQNEPDDRDLLEFFGIAGGDLKITAETLTVGTETVSLADARRALHEHEPPGRTVAIGDLSDG
jgi:hypothetical protein